MIVGLLWIHVGILPLFGAANGRGLLHSTLESLVVAGFAIGASMSSVSRTARSVLATLGLTTSSALLTHFSGGLIEMHFHFFVMVAIVTLYQSWLPFAFAIGFVLIHHGVAGAIEPGGVYNHPDAILHPWKWASIHALFIAGESIACLAAWRLNEDALERERSARGALEKANNDLAEAQEIARVGSWEWDLESGSLWWSEELHRIFGTPPTPTIAGRASFLELLHPEDVAGFAAEVERIKSGAVSRLETECRIVRPDGEIRVVRIIGSASLETPGKGRVVGTSQDITEQKQLEQEIEYKAFHDPLTDLANRGLFRDRLVDALQRPHPVSVVFMDLDDFKTVNDTLGHIVGDELLVKVARTLESLVRPDDLVARFGGDEFAILIDDGSSAVDVAERIYLALEAPMILNSVEVVTGVSMGVATAEGTHTADELLRDADIAMYTVKASGESGFAVCSAEMRSTAIKRLELKTELKRALENDEFVVHYQPIVSLLTQEMVGLEALVRWNHPQRGLIPPIDFIPLAEESGAIVPLGSWVLHEAAREAKALQELMERSYSISVNLSARQLHEVDLLDTVHSALQSTGLNAENLVLEITETFLMGSPESSIRTLNGLRDLGVRIAVDDFGTGYSSLSYLHRFPIDVLKIDRAFVAGVAESPEKTALAQAVVKLATALDLRTVAEGIETPEQLVALEALGCRNGQGFLFAEALPMPELEAWILERTSRGVARANDARLTPGSSGIKASSNRLSL
ncbi:MAG: EAL domain-containing protein [Actinobacteria bacterium]|nr:EAL domain-containing protein [Actinomycetota bacterium]